MRQLQRRQSGSGRPRLIQLRLSPAICALLQSCADQALDYRVCLAGPTSAPCPTPPEESQGPGSMKQFSAMVHHLSTLLVQCVPPPGWIAPLRAMLGPCPQAGDQHGVRPHACRNLRCLCRCQPQLWRHITCLDMPQLTTRVTCACRRGGGVRPGLAVRFRPPNTRRSQGPAPAASRASPAPLCCFAAIASSLVHQRLRSR